MLGLAVLVTLAVVQPGHDTQPGPTPHESSSPALLGLHLAHATPERLGRRPVGARADRQLTFVNNGPLALSLQVVSKTCGCVSAVFEPARVEPGEQSVLVLSVIVPATLGEQQQAVRFAVSDGSKRADGACGLSYSADAPFEYWPGAVEIPTVQGSTAFIYVHLRFYEAAGIQAASLGRASCELPDTTVDGPLMPEGSPTMRAYRVTVTPGEAGVALGEVLIPTGLPDRPVVSTRIVRRTYSAVRCQPPGLILGDDRRQGTVDLLVRSLDMGAPPQEWSGPITATWKHGADPAWLEVTTGPPRISVSVPVGSPSGGDWVEIRDGRGHVVGSLPVAWNVPR
jgi:hypothetical protein